MCRPRNIISVDKCYIAGSFGVDKSALRPRIGRDFTVEKVEIGTSRFGSTEIDTVIKTDVMDGIENWTHNLSQTYNLHIDFNNSLTFTHSLNSQFVHFLPDKSPSIISNLSNSE